MAASAHFRLVLFALVALAGVSMAALTNPYRSTGFLSQAQKNPKLTYGQLARAVAPYAWYHVINALPTFNESSCPSEGDLNGAIVYFRQVYDVFAYTYPQVYPPGETKELFHLLYKDLTDGYQATGHCGDLGKVNHTEADRQRVLKHALKWKANFIKRIAQYDYTSFAMTPSMDEIFVRPKAELSYQYWGSSDFVPSENLSARDNFAMLGRGQWITLYKEKASVFNMTDIWIPELHDIYHDYRKLARYATLLLDPSDGDIGFGDLVMRNITNQTNLSWDLGHNMGVINDLIVGYYFFNETGNTTAAQNNLAKIKTLWPQLQQWIDDVDWLGNVQYVIDSFIPVGFF